VVCGHPHVGAKNVEGLIEEGYRWLMATPTRSFSALELGRERVKELASARKS
jgi:4-hydroxy-2-oxoheptanedioate aldolase